MNELFKNLLDTDAVWDLFDPQSITFLAVALVIMFVGKLINNWTTPYNLNKELTEHDNKAISLSFGGYILALGIIVFSVLDSDTSFEKTGAVHADMLKDILDTFIWGAIAIILLQLARFASDKIILFKFSNTKELVEDRNVGTGAVQCGMYIGVAFIVKAALAGDDTVPFATALVSTLIYFVIAIIFFALYSVLYQKITRFDFHDEIEKDNEAAGVSFGMNLAAIGIILSGYIIKSDSLPGLAVWFIISSLLLITCRYIIDKVILPGSLLDDEISRDRNWGAAIVEGASALSLAFILNTIF